MYAHGESINRAGVFHRTSARQEVSTSVPKRNWDLQFSSAYSSVRGFHIYDATQNGVSISYSRPLRRMFNDNSNAARAQYPIRFSAGIQQETFFNFPGAQNSTFRPYAEISIF